MKSIYVCVLSLLFAEAAGAAPRTNAVVHMREPFSVTLQIDEDNVYDLAVTNKTPYVLQNSVFVFPDDSFGVSVSNSADGVISIRYEPDKRKQDVAFRFQQHASPGDEPFMILTSHNKTDRRLRFQVFKALHDRDKPVYSGQVDVYPKIPTSTGIPGVVTSLTLFGFEVIEPPKNRAESNKASEDIGAGAPNPQR